MEKFNDYLKTYVKPKLSKWQKVKAFTRSFFKELGKQNRLGFELKNDEIIEQLSLKQALLLETLSKLSPGMAIIVLVQISLGTKVLHLVGTEK